MHRRTRCLGLPQSLCLRFRLTPADRNQMACAEMAPCYTDNLLFSLPTGGGALCPLHGARTDAVDTTIQC